jgi:type II secretory pathway component PulF
MIIVVVIFLCLVVIPQFESTIIQLGGEVPTITKIVMGISKFVQNYFFIILLGFAFLISLAKSFLYFNRFESLSVVENRLNTITPSELLDIANNIFKETNLFTLTYSNR